MAPVQKYLDAAITAALAAGLELTDDEFGAIGA
jgi:hypothetical protein